MQKRGHIIWATLLAAIMLPTMAPAATTGQLLQKAEQEKRLALENSEDVQAAAQHLGNAIDCYEEARADGVANATIYSELGALYLQKGELGPAILNLKKALIFSPHRRSVLDNLRIAQSRRIDKYPDTQARGALRMIAFFHYDIGYPTRVTIALAAWILLCAIGIILLWKRPLWLCTLAVLVAATAIIFGSSAMITCHTLKHNRLAVVSATETIPRKGDSEAFKPAVNEPLHAGTVISVKMTRGEWSYAILPGGIPSWIKNSDIVR